MSKLLKFYTVGSTVQSYSVVSAAQTLGGKTFWRRLFSNPTVSKIVSSVRGVFVTRQKTRREIVAGKVKDSLDKTVKICSLVISQVNNILDRGFIGIKRTVVSVLASVRRFPFRKLTKRCIVIYVAASILGCMIYYKKLFKVMEGTAYVDGMTYTSIKSRNQRPVANVYRRFYQSVKFIIFCAGMMVLKNTYTTSGSSLLKRSNAYRKGKQASKRPETITISRHGAPLIRPRVLLEEIDDSSDDTPSLVKKSETAQELDPTEQPVVNIGELPLVEIEPVPMTSTGLMTFLDRTRKILNAILGRLRGNKQPLRKRVTAPLMMATHGILAKFGLVKRMSRKQRVEVMAARLSAEARNFMRTIKTTKISSRPSVISCLIVIMIPLSYLVIVKGLPRVKQLYVDLTSVNTTSAGVTGTVIGVPAAGPILINTKLATPLNAIIRVIKTALILFGFRKPSRAEQVIGRTLRLVFGARRARFLVSRVKSFKTKLLSLTIIKTIKEVIKCINHRHVIQSGAVFSVICFLYLIVWPSMCQVWDYANRLYKQGRKTHIKKTHSKSLFDLFVKRTKESVNKYRGGVIRVVTTIKKYHQGALDGIARPDLAVKLLSKANSNKPLTEYELGMVSTIRGVHSEHVTKQLADHLNGIHKLTKSNWFERNGKWIKRGVYLAIFAGACYLGYKYLKESSTKASDTTEPEVIDELEGPSKEQKLKIVTNVINLVNDGSDVSGIGETGSSIIGLYRTMPTSDTIIDDIVEQAPWNNSDELLTTIHNIPSKEDIVVNMTKTSLGSGVKTFVKVILKYFRSTLKMAVTSITLSAISQLTSGILSNLAQKSATTLKYVAALTMVIETVACIANNVPQKYAKVIYTILALVHDVPVTIGCFFYGVLGLEDDNAQALVVYTDISIRILKFGNFIHRMLKPVMGIFPDALTGYVSQATGALVKAYIKDIALSRSQNPGASGEAMVLGLVKAATFVTQLPLTALIKAIESTAFITMGDFRVDVVTTTEQMEDGRLRTVQISRLTTEGGYANPLHMPEYLRGKPMQVSLEQGAVKAITGGPTGQLMITGADYDQESPEQGAPEIGEAGSSTGPGTDDGFTVVKKGKDGKSFTSGAPLASAHSVKMQQVGKSSEKKQATVGPVGKQTPGFATPGQSIKTSLGKRQEQGSNTTKPALEKSRVVPITTTSYIRDIEEFRKSLGKKAFEAKVRLVEQMKAKVEKAGYKLQSNAIFSDFQREIDIIAQGDKAVLSTATLDEIAKIKKCKNTNELKAMITFDMPEVVLLAFGIDDRDIEPDHWTVKRYSTIIQSLTMSVIHITPFDYVSNTETSRFLGFLREVAVKLEPDYSARMITIYNYYMNSIASFVKKDRVAHFNKRGAKPVTINFETDDKFFEWRPIRLENYFKHEARKQTPQLGVVISEVENNHSSDDEGAGAPIDDEAITFDDVEITDIDTDDEIEINLRKSVHESSDTKRLQAALMDFTWAQPKDFVSYGIKKAHERTEEALGKIKETLAEEEEELDLELDKNKAKLESYIKEKRERSKEGKGKGKGKARPTKPHDTFTEKSKPAVIPRPSWAIPDVGRAEGMQGTIEDKPTQSSTDEVLGETAMVVTRSFVPTSVGPQARFSVREETAKSTEESEPDMKKTNGSYVNISLVVTVVCRVAHRLIDLICRVPLGPLSPVKIPLLVVKPIVKVLSWAGSLVLVAATMLEVRNIFYGTYKAYIGQDSNITFVIPNGKDVVYKAFLSKHTIESFKIESQNFTRMPKLLVSNSSLYLIHRPVHNINNRKSTWTTHDISQGHRLRSGMMCNGRGKIAHCSNLQLEREEGVINGKRVISDRIEVDFIACAEHLFESAVGKDVVAPDFFCESNLNAGSAFRTQIMPYTCNRDIEKGEVIFQTDKEGNMSSLGFVIASARVLKKAIVDDMPYTLTDSSITFMLCNSSSLGGLSGSPMVDYKGNLIGVLTNETVDSNLYAALINEMVPIPQFRIAIIRFGSARCVSTYVKSKPSEKPSLVISTNLDELDDFHRFTSRCTIDAKSKRITDADIDDMYITRVIGHGEAILLSEARLERANDEVNMSENDGDEVYNYGDEEEEESGENNHDDVSDDDENVDPKTGMVITIPTSLRTLVINDIFNVGMNWKETTKNTTNDIRMKFLSCMHWLFSNDPFGNSDHINVPILSGETTSTIASIIAIITPSFVLKYFSEMNTVLNFSMILGKKVRFSAGHLENDVAVIVGAARSKAMFEDRVSDPTTVLRTDPMNFVNVALALECLRNNRAAARNFAGFTKKQVARLPGQWSEEYGMAVGPSDVLENADQINEPINVRERDAMANIVQLAKLVLSDDRLAKVSRGVRVDNENPFPTRDDIIFSYRTGVNYQDSVRAMDRRVVDFIIMICQEQHIEISDYEEEDCRIVVLIVQCCAGLRMRLTKVRTTGSDIFSVVANPKVLDCLFVMMDLLACYISPITRGEFKGNQLKNVLLDLRGVNFENLGLIFSVIIGQLACLCPFDSVTLVDDTNRNSGFYRSMVKELQEFDNTYGQPESNNDEDPEYLGFMKTLVSIYMVMQNLQVIMRENPKDVNFLTFETKSILIATAVARSADMAEDVPVNIRRAILGRIRGMVTSYSNFDPILRVTRIPREGSCIRAIDNRFGVLAYNETMDGTVRNIDRWSSLNKLVNTVKIITKRALLVQPFRVLGRALLRRADLFERTTADIVERTAERINSLIPTIMRNRYTMVNTLQTGFKKTCGWLLRLMKGVSLINHVMMALLDLSLVKIMGSDLSTIFPKHYAICFGAAATTIICKNLVMWLKPIGLVEFKNDLRMLARITTFASMILSFVVTLRCLNIATEETRIFGNENIETLLAVMLLRLEELASVVIEEGPKVIEIAKIASIAIVEKIKKEVATLTQSKKTMLTMKVPAIIMAMTEFSYTLAHYLSFDNASMYYATLIENKNLASLGKARAEAVRDAITYPNAFKNMYNAAMGRTRPVASGHGMLIKVLASFGLPLIMYSTLALSCAFAFRKLFNYMQDRIIRDARLEHASSLTKDWNDVIKRRRVISTNITKTTLIMGWIGFFAKCLTVDIVSAVYANTVLGVFIIYALTNNDARKVISKGIAADSGYAHLILTGMHVILYMFDGDFSYCLAILTSLVCMERDMGSVTGGVVMLYMTNGKNVVSRLQQLMLTLHKKLSRNTAWLLIVMAVTHLTMSFTDKIKNDALIEHTAYFTDEWCKTVENVKYREASSIVADAIFSSLEVWSLNICLDSEYRTWPISVLSTLLLIICKRWMSDHNVDARKHFSNLVSSILFVNELAYGSLWNLLLSPSLVRKLFSGIDGNKVIQHEGVDDMIEIDVNDVRLSMTDLASVAILYGRLVCEEDIRKIFPDFPDLLMDQLKIIEEEGFPMNEQLFYDSEKMEVLVEHLIEVIGKQSRIRNNWMQELELTYQQMLRILGTDQTRLDKVFEQKKKLGSILQASVNKQAPLHRVISEIFDAKQYYKSDAVVHNEKSIVFIGLLDGFSASKESGPTRVEHENAEVSQELLAIMKSKFKGVEWVTPIASSGSDIQLAQSFRQRNQGGADALNSWTKAINSSQGSHIMMSSVADSTDMFRSVGVRYIPIEMFESVCDIDDLDLKESSTVGIMTKLAIFTSGGMKTLSQALKVRSWRNVDVELPMQQLFNAFGKQETNPRKAYKELSKELHVVDHTCSNRIRIIQTAEGIERIKHRRREVFFNTQIKVLRWVIPIKVGLKVAGEWPTSIEMVSAKRFIVTLDITNYDGNQHRGLFALAAVVRALCCINENGAEKAIVHSAEACFRQTITRSGIVTEVIGTMASGDINTTSDNSVRTMIMMQAINFTLLEENDNFIPIEFMLQGDNIIAAHDDLDTLMRIEKILETWGWPCRIEGIRDLRNQLSPCILDEYLGMNGLRCRIRFENIFRNTSVIERIVPWRNPDRVMGKLLSSHSLKNQKAITRAAKEKAIMWLMTWPLDKNIIACNEILGTTNQMLVQSKYVTKRETVKDTGKLETVQASSVLAGWDYWVSKAIGIPGMIDRIISVEYINHEGHVVSTDELHRIEGDLRSVPVSRYRKKKATCGIKQYALTCHCNNGMTIMNAYNEGLMMGHVKLTIIPASVSKQALALDRYDATIYCKRAKVIAGTIECEIFANMITNDM